MTERFQREVRGDAGPQAVFVATVDDDVERLENRGRQRTAPEVVEHEVIASRGELEQSVELARYQGQRWDADHHAGKPARDEGAGDRHGEMGLSGTWRASQRETLTVAGE